MRSEIYTGKVMHYRKGKEEHGFTYPVYYYSLDLDKLEDLSKEILIFSYNKKNIASIFDSDYLTETPGTIKEKALNYLKKYDCNDEVEKIFLVTSARYFNYVFNPVSFYYCYSPNNELLYLLVEINNTFGERHIYILNDNLLKENEDRLHYRHNKEFHVSPFYEVEGEYDFYFKDISETLDVKINIRKQDKEIFFTRLWGKSKSMNSKNVISTIVKYPLTTTLTMPRILWQAAKLHYVKGLPAYFKPKPINEHTVVNYYPSLRYRIAERQIKKIFEKIKYGCLLVEFPNKETKTYGDKESGLKVDIKIDHYKFFWDILIKGDISIGENYTEGLYKTSNLTNLLKLLLYNREYIEDALNYYSKILQVKYFLQHCLRKNNLLGAKKNISAHYDLSNKLFSLFLDSTMTYSGAIFTKIGEDLETAQIRKLDTIIEKAKISQNDHVLEVGCGWGSFAIRAAQKTGCKLTCITLSKEQADFFQKRVVKLGLQNQIDIQLKDFREVRGKFDKIVSIEMVEAIGYKNYPAYFKMMERVLRPNGLVVIQAITFPDQAFKALRHRCDWIQQYIFPGSLIPSINALTSAMQDNSKLIVENIENIGDSYAETLRQWKERFNLAKNDVVAQGFDERFIKTWNYYLSYCEAAFETKTLGNIHMVLTRPANQSLEMRTINE